MEILIQEPKMKSIWYLPEVLGSYIRYEDRSEIWSQQEDEHSSFGLHKVCWSIFFLKMCNFCNKWVWEM